MTGTSGVTMLTGKRVSALDPVPHSATLSTGETIGYGAPRRLRDRRLRRQTLPKLPARKPSNV